MENVYLSLILFFVLYGQALGLSDEEITAYAIASAVLIAYIVIDIVLLGLIVWCCRRKEPLPKSKRRHVRKLRNSSSVEYVDGTVVLKLEKKREVDALPTVQEVECSFNDQEEDDEEIKKDLGQISAEEKESTVLTPHKLSADSHKDLANSSTSNEEVFQPETHPHTPERKRSSNKPHRSSAVRKDSETFLLAPDDKSDDEDCDQVASPARTRSPQSLNESLGQIRETEVETQTELQTEMIEKSELERSQSPDERLISITSKITGPILPDDGPVGNVPREIQSLDLNTINEAQIRSGSMVQEETSFNKSSSFVNHERTGSNLSRVSNGSIPLDSSTNRGSGLNNSFGKGSEAYHSRHTSSPHLTPHASDVNLNTVSGSSLGYSHVDKQIKQVDIYLEQLLSSQSVGSTPVHRQIPAQPSNTPTISPTRDLLNGTGRPSGSPVLNLPSHRHSLSQTHPHIVPRSRPVANADFHTKSQSLIDEIPPAILFKESKSSVSATNTPIHRVKT